MKPPGVERICFQSVFIRIFACRITNNKHINMITTDQLHDVVEREQALRGYL